MNETFGKSTSSVFDKTPAKLDAVMREEMPEEWQTLQQALLNVLQHRRFVSGPEVEQLEHVLANWLGTRYAIGCNSGFGANLLSLFALQLRPGAKVAVSAFAPHDDAGLLLRQNLVPVLIDTAPDDVHLDPHALAQQPASAFDAVFVHHLFGGAANMKALLQIAGARPVIEVLTYSFGARCADSYAGSLGTLATCCLREETTLGAYGDAGMLWTNREDLYHKIMRLRNQTAGNGGYDGTPSGCFLQDTIHAAVLLSKFKSWRRPREKRREQAAGFAQKIAARNVPALTVPPFHRAHSTHFVIFAEQRDALASHLKQRGFAVEAWWPKPIHLQSGFKKLGYARGDFPNAEHLASHSLELVLPDQEEEQEALVDCLSEFFSR